MTRMTTRRCTCTAVTSIGALQTCSLTVRRQACNCKTWLLRSQHCMYTFASNPMRTCHACHCKTDIPLLAIAAGHYMQQLAQYTEDVRLPHPYVLPYSDADADVVHSMCTSVAIAMHWTQQHSNLLYYNLEADPTCCGLRPSSNGMHCTTLSSQRSMPSGAALVQSRMLLAFGAHRQP